MAAMKSALTALMNLITADAQIIAMIAEYTYSDDSTGPAVFNKRAPNDAVMPYIVANGEDAVPDENEITETMNYVLDIWVDTSSGEYDDTHTHAIADRIQAILYAAQPEVNGRAAVGVYWDIRVNVTEDDETTEHLHMEFNIKYRRIELCNP